MDFNSWLTNQGIDPNVFPDKERVREVYEQAQLRGEALQATTLGPSTTGGYGYAVAIEDGADLRVTLWVKRGPKICVVLQPRDREWNPHATYHLDGQYHNKSYGIALGVQQRQRLEHFKGTEHLGVFMGTGGRTEDELQTIWPFEPIAAHPRTLAALRVELLALKPRVA